MGNIVLYGAGKDLADRIHRWKDATFLIVDRDVDKIKNGFMGYEVKGPEIIETLTKEDTIFITTRKFYHEVREYIEEKNKEVTIYPIYEAEWVLGKKLRDIIPKEGYQVVINTAEWVNGLLTDELEFWERRLAEQKEKYPEQLKRREFRYGLFPQLEFNKEDTILDLGSGPTPFGNLINGEKVNYIPLDPLAYQYRKILKKNEIVMPVEPSFAIMELLSCFFEENYADYIIINNALDHCMDTLCALLEAYKVLKKDGYLCLYHFEAEGFFNNYEGLHQWNVVCVDGELWFFNKTNSINISKLFHDFAEVTVENVSSGCRRMVKALIKKKEDAPEELSERYNIKKLSGEMINVLFQKLIEN